MDGGRFYIQLSGEQKIASVQQQLASLNLQETPLIGAFNPRKGDIVLAQFSADNSWNRAMVRVNIPELPLIYFTLFVLTCMVLFCGHYGQIN